MSMFDPPRGAGTVEIHEEHVVEETIHANHPAWQRYLAEFVGTFFIVFAGGCVWGRKHQSSIGLLAIGGVIGSCVYLFRARSGGHLNPAVTLSVALTRRHMLGHVDAIVYIIVQLLAGVCGGFAWSKIVGTMPKLVTDGGASGDGAQMWLCSEFIFTWAMCYVFLSAVTSSDFPNQYYGIAVGLIFVPGCGCALNPALALSVDLAQQFSGGSPKWGALGWTVLAETLGALLAAAAFYGVRHEEFDGTHGHQHRHLAELLGTFIVVFTVIGSVALAPDMAALCIGSAILAMTYAFGPVSGAHFNPGITLGVLATHHDLLPGVEAAYYIVTQFVAGTLAGVVLGKLSKGKGTKDRMLNAFGEDAAKIAAVEIIFTALLVLTFLVVVTSVDAPNQYCGIAMGLTAIGVYLAAMPLSGAVLNPAVALGLDVAGSLNNKDFGNCLGYLLYELIGVALAAGIFLLFWYGDHHAEYVESDHVTVREGPIGNSIEEQEMTQRLTSRDDEMLSPPYY